MPNPTAIIVGAGISGLSAAWWLDKAGWNSIILERSSCLRDGGYILSLAGLGLETLRRMDLRNDLDDASYKLDTNLLSDQYGREVLRLKYEDVHLGEDSIAVCRDDLARILANALPKTSLIRFGETLESFTDEGSKVLAVLSNGETIGADLLIAADGVRSSVRDHLWKDEECLEHLGYSFAVYDYKDKIELKESCVSFNSPGRLDVLYHLRDHRLAVLHIWRNDLTRPQDSQRGFDAIRTASSGAAELVADAIDRAEKANVTPLIDSLTMVTLSNWSKGRVLLLGDAAHCLTLMSGQGASLAIASAEILSKELMNAKDITEALSNHEKRVRRIAEKLQDRSRRIASMYIPKSKFMYYLNNWLMRLMPYSWVISWHRQSSKVELDLAKEDSE